MIMSIMVNILIYIMTYLTNMFLYLYKLGLKSITQDVVRFSPEVCSFRIPYHGSSCANPLKNSELTSQEMNDGATLGIYIHAYITCVGNYVKIM